MSYKIKVASKAGNETKILSAEPQDRLIDVLESNGISIYAPCGGKCLCGKCLVKINSGRNGITPDETDFISPKQAEQGYRLACAYRIDSDAEVLLDDNFGGSIMTKVLKRDYILDPVDAPSGDNGEKNYGVAFDIGTTTVVGYLLDMETGDIKGTVSEMNAQRIYGSDVISRISYTMDNEQGQDKMNKAIIDQIASFLKRLAAKNKIGLNNITSISFAGNTTMLHFLMNLDARGIAVAPFTPSNLKEIITTAGGLNIPIKELSACKVYILPCIASYVGADITAAILASGMTKSSKLSLLLDIGTNGEIALGNNEKVVTCSTAAGPAFEGACIKHGMGGIPGAIDSVKISDGEIFLTTIGEEPAKGICGSGVIDAVAQLLAAEIVDETGRMVYPDEAPAGFEDKIIEDENSRELILIRKEDGQNISITAEDVREIQLAKAAIAAGVNVLLMRMGKTAKDVDRVFLAGGFGSYIDKESAVKIGLLGKAFRDRIIAIGNAAGAGAIQVLLSKEGMKKCVDISTESEYIELSNSKEFQDEYVECMMFEN